MNDKYIIKNCPALGFQIGYYCSDRADYCKNCTDCILKQIVKQAGYCLCPEILELLNIEEVE